MIIIMLLTLFVPLTGIHIHKVMGTFFLLFCIIHIIKTRRKFTLSKFYLLILVLVSFITGVFAYIYDLEIIKSIHTILAILMIAFVGIHIYIYHRRVFKKKKEDKNEN